MAFNREKVIRSAEKYVSKGKLESAIKEYRKVLSHNPNDTNTLNRLGDLYARVEKFDEAVRLFTQIAEQYTKDGFLLKAIAIYKKIIKLAPGSLPVYERLAELYSKQGLLNEARQQYQVLAEYYEKHDNATSVVTIYQKMSQLEPENPSYHLKLAELYSRQQLTDKALASYRQLADILIVNGSVDEATQVYLKALDVSSEDLDFVREAVRGLNENGHVGAAAQVLARASELNPAASQLAAEVGLGQESPLEEEPEAEPAFEATPEPSPSDDPFDVSAEVSFGDLGQMEQPVAEPEPTFDATVEVEDDTEFSFADADLEDSGTLVQPPEEEEMEFELSLEGMDEEGGDGEILLEGEFEPEPAQAESELEIDEEEAIRAASEEINLGGDPVEPELTEVDWSSFGDMADLELPPIDSDEPVPVEGFDPTGDASFADFELDDEPTAITTVSEEASTPEEPAAPPPSPPVAPAPPPDPEPSLPAFEVESAETFEVEPTATFEPATFESETFESETFEPEMEIDLEETAAVLSEPEPEPEPESPPATVTPPTGPGEAVVAEAEEDGEQAPAVRREEDLLAECQVFIKYGLLEKAQDRLQEVLRLNPEHVEALALEARMHLDAGSHQEALEGANRVSLLARETGELPVWSSLKAELKAAGYSLAGDEVLEEPAEKPAKDNRIAKFLENLDETPEPPVAPPVEPPATEAPRPKRSRADRSAEELLDDLVASTGARTSRPPASEAAPPSAAETAEAIASSPAFEALSQEHSGDNRKMFSLADELGLDDLEDELGFGGEDDSPVAVANPSPVPEPEPESEIEALDETGMGWLDDMAADAETAKEPTESLFDDEDDFFDLAAELERELSDDELNSDEGIIQPQEQSLEEIIEGFKQGVAENLSEADYDTHFNLGIAYREMGLLDEAIGEFQLASKDERHLVECSSLLGICFLEKGLPELAVRWYRKGLESPAISEEATLGLLYDMGEAYIATGDSAAAYQTFVEIYGLKSNYRDVSTRLEELRAE